LHHNLNVWPLQLLFSSFTVSILSAGGFVAETLFFASLHLVRLPYCC
jgi:hypothetical protein